MLDEAGNSERIAQGLMLFEPLQAQKKEGPSASRYRKLLERARVAGKRNDPKDVQKYRDLAAKISIGPRTRAAMEHNGRLPATNREIKKRNLETKASDEMVRELRTLLHNEDPHRSSWEVRIRALHLSLPAHVRAWVTDLESQAMHAALPQRGFQISRDGLGRGRVAAATMEDSAGRSPALMLPVRSDSHPVLWVGIAHHVGSHAHGLRP